MAMRSAAKDGMATPAAMTAAKPTVISLRVMFIGLLPVRHRLPATIPPLNMVAPVQSLVRRAGRRQRRGGPAGKSGDALDAGGDFRGLEHAFPVVLHQHGLAELDGLV